MSTDTQLDVKIQKDSNNVCVSDLFHMGKMRTPITVTYRSFITPPLIKRFKDTNMGVFLGNRILNIRCVIVQSLPVNKMNM